MPALLPDWLNPDPWLTRARNTDTRAVQQALATECPGIAELAALLSPVAGEALERLAARAQLITHRQFGRTISLYVPLYLSDFCKNGCIYCGFAADRRRSRRRLERDDIIVEMDALKAMGFEEILLLTGERTLHADFDYVRASVALAAERFDLVAVEVFPMTHEEYHILAEVGCTGMTMYQETYDPVVYERMHRWGPKRDYQYRLETPARALAAGLRTAGLGTLLGLADPVRDALALFQHVQTLRKQYWRAGISVSFPRIRPQLGGFTPPFLVSDRFLVQVICAFRICMPDLPLILSTREPALFRDGIAGIGISKMSIASRTTVGGYHDGGAADDGQFKVNDNRSIEAFCTMLKSKELEPVFKNWDAVYRDIAQSA
ncbi:MAG: 2-iminoacetate synthase ThiH [Verrucomicrobia bacterium]|nr:2-iminoacetate synthase ThiH [Verrucomicrobiota bacterium]MBU1735509.1 2-iminoacetate synthase ThiH [Verrucomicrobiota bacterium]MBU1856904.1 2-iminoacetate synthase ThiH [Verrucomicrobiota bacterium]